MHVEIDQVNNGYTFNIETNGSKYNGKYVCKSTEEFQMLEKIGEAILGYKIKVDRR